MRISSRACLSVCLDKQAFQYITHAHKHFYLQYSAVQLQPCFSQSSIKRLPFLHLYTLMCRWVEARSMNANIMLTSIAACLWTDGWWRTAKCWGTALHVDEAVLESVCVCMLTQHQQQQSQSVHIQWGRNLCIFTEMAIFQIQRDCKLSPTVKLESVTYSEIQICIDAVRQGYVCLKWDKSVHILYIKYTSTKYIYSRTI